MDCDVNQGIGLNVSTIVLLALTAIIVAMRFAVRVWIVKDVGWDDWTILFALVRSIQALPQRWEYWMLIELQVGTLIGSALDFVEVHYGFGRHQDCLSSWQLQEFKKYVYGEWIQTFATLMWTKVSICLFLLRIPIRKIVVRPLQASIAILIVSNIILTLLWILQCHPVNAAWDGDVSGKCFSRGQLLRIVLAQASKAFFPLLVNMLTNFESSL